jgi:hypothetical protein
MTVKEWAREYPEIATSVFNCSVDDLDSVLEEKHVNKSGNKYLTQADLDKYMNKVAEMLEQ